MAERTKAEPAAATFADAAALGDGELVDWGPVAEPLGGPVSRTRGRLLAGGGGLRPEAGYWECSPGAWRCVVEHDEFCHFLAGRCVYTADDGARIEIAGGVSAFFPAGWHGRCDVTETVRKVYMIA